MIIDSSAILAIVFREPGFEEILEIPFGELHWREAVEVFRRFGRGRHPASLNFGDCMTYAVAQLAGEPLLFPGEDFVQTDVEGVARIG